MCVCVCEREREREKRREAESEREGENLRLSVVELVNNALVDLHVHHLVELFVDQLFHGHHADHDQ